MKDGKEWLSCFQIFYSLVEGKGVAYMKKKIRWQKHTKMDYSEVNKCQIAVRAREFGEERYYEIILKNH